MEKKQFLSTNDGKSRLRRSQEQLAKTENEKVSPNLAQSSQIDVNAGPDSPRQETVEVDGPDGPDPTRYGDWERNGRCIDF